MPIQTYEKCKANTVTKIIKIYEKDKSKKIPRKQTIAIALSIAEKGCKSKLSKDDIIKKEENINNFLKDKDGNAKLSVINDYRIVCNYYMKTKEYVKVIELQSIFMKKILKIQRNNELSESAYNSLMKK
jgi:hypothetical protein